jgi:phospho-N-acetylmuramoyl-pentapeptide-transferase
MGGVLVWGSILLTVGFSRLLSFLGVIEKSVLSRSEVYLPLFTLISMGILGAIDDWFNIRGIGKKKGIDVTPKFFLLTFFATLGAWWFYAKLGYDTINIPFLGQFYINGWYIPLFMFVIVGTANAVNITDGLDGLAGGLLIIAFTTFGVIAYAEGKTFLTIFCGIADFSLLGFLWYNIPPAKFFMGDTGSLALGATLGVMAMMLDSLAVLPLIGAIFVVETLSVMIQVVSKKLRNGKKVFNIAPLHHHLESLGWGEAKVVMRLWMIGSFFAFLGLIIELIS